MNSKDLKCPVFLKETAPNVTILLDMAVDATETWETQTDCYFEYIVQKKNAATITIQHRKRKYYLHKRFTNMGTQINRPAYHRKETKFQQSSTIFQNNNFQISTKKHFRQQSNKLGKLIVARSKDITMDVNKSFVFKWWRCK